MKGCPVGALKCIDDRVPSACTRWHVLHVCHAEHEVLGALTRDAERIAIAVAYSHGQRLADLADETSILAAIIDVTLAG